MIETDPPKDLFKGVNFVTPNILGYYKLKDDNYAELSTGRGIDGQEIFGITVRPYDKASKLCYSRKEALDYIGELS